MAEQRFLQTIAELKAEGVTEVRGSCGNYLCRAVATRRQPEIKRFTGAGYVQPS
jgi:hypothetical protein